VGGAPGAHPVRRDHSRRSWDAVGGRGWSLKRRFATGRHGAALSAQTSTAIRRPTSERCRPSRTLEPMHLVPRTHRPLADRYRSSTIRRTASPRHVRLGSTRARSSRPRVLCGGDHRPSQRIPPRRRTRSAPRTRRTIGPTNVSRPGTAARMPRTQNEAQGGPRSCPDRVRQLGVSVRTEASLELRRERRGVIPRRRRADGVGADVKDEVLVLVSAKHDGSRDASTGSAARTLGVS
jgi:hypothetical protein